MAEQLMATCTVYGFLCLFGVVACATGAMERAFRQAEYQGKYTGIGLIILGAVITLLCYLRLTYYVQEVLNLG